MGKAFSVIITVAAFGIAGCAAGSTATVTKTAAAAGPVTTSSAGNAVTTSSAATQTTPAQAKPQPKMFQGTGQEALGTIVVPTDTTISWSCPNCASSNFIINNAQSDANAIPTNSLNQTSGVDPLPAGTYHTVVVDTTGGPWTVTIGSPAATPTTTTATAPSGPSAAPTNQATPEGPGPVLRTHLQDLGSGQYQSAFDLLSPGYQAGNPSWIQARSAADPGITVISVGAPANGSGSAQVPVDFYARDRNSTQGSDTRCRDFQGTASMVNENGSWRYNPDGNHLTATVVPSANPNCP